MFTPLHFQRTIENIFLAVNFNMCFGWSKEPSHWDGSFKYPQHMFWFRNKKINFWLRTFIWRPALFYTGNHQTDILANMKTLMKWLIVQCGISSGSTLFNKAKKIFRENNLSYISCRECSGSVVECLAWDGGAAGKSLIGDTVLCPWARTLILVKYWFNPGRPSFYNWKIVDGT